MKQALTIMAAVLCLVAFSSCEENPVQEYGRGLTRSLDKAYTTADQANLDALGKSIAAYHAAEGRYPESLTEITSAMGLDPARFDYDPATGHVALRQ